MNKRTLVTGLIGFVVTWIPLTSNADISSELEKFYDEIGVNANTTNAGVYQGQAAGYATLGGFSARNNNQRKYNLLSVTQPLNKYNSSCGNIDSYLGGFSYINKEQAIQMLKNVGKNARMMIFQMGVKTVSEMIGNTMEGIADKLQDFTKATVDTCEAANSLVKSAGNVWDAVMKGNVNDGATQKGAVEDPAEANTKTIGELADSYTQEELVAEQISGNLMWIATGKVNVLKDNPKLRKLLMAYSGTLILNPKASNKNDLVKIIPKLVQDKALEDLFKRDTANFVVYDCVDPDYCMFTETTTTTIAINFKNDIRAALERIATAIRNGERLNENSPVDKFAIQLIRDAEIPVYKFMRAAVANRMEMLFIDAYSSVLAVKMFQKFNEEVAVNINQKIAEIQTLPTEQVREFIDNFSVLSGQLIALEKTLEDVLDNAYTHIRLAEQLEKRMVKNLPSKFRKAYFFKSA